MKRCAIRQYHEVFNNNKAWNEMMRHIMPYRGDIHCTSAISAQTTTAKLVAARDAAVTSELRDDNILVPGKTRPAHETDGNRR